MPCHHVQKVDAYQYAELALNFVKVGRHSHSPQPRATAFVGGVKRGEGAIVTASAKNGIGNKFYE